MSVSSEIEKALGLAEQDEPSVDDVNYEGDESGTDLWSRYTSEFIGPGMSGALWVNTVAQLLSNDLPSFLNENPGLVSAIEAWVIDHIDKVPEWKQRIRDMMYEYGDEGEPGD